MYFPPLPHMHGRHFDSPNQDENVFHDMRYTE